MNATVIEVLVLAGVFCATYGFLYACDWLARQLAKRGLTADLRAERMQAGHCSGIAPPEIDAPVWCEWSARQWVDVGE